MIDTFTVSLPAATSASDQQEIASALQHIESVQGARVSQSRSIDGASALVLVKLAAEIITTTGAAIPVIQKVVDLVRGKGVKGAKINLPGGATLQIDEASTADIERLMRAAAK